MYRNKKNIVGTSSFLNVFGDSDKARVLDFFIENKMFEYSFEEAHKATGINEERLEEIFKVFFEFGILAFISNDKGQFYALADNDIAKSLLSLDNELIAINVRVIEKIQSGV